MAQEDRKVGRFQDGTRQVTGALIEVHRCLGPGLLESAYEACVCAELVDRGIPFERQRPISVTYKDAHVECGYRLDLVVDDRILLELKPSNGCCRSTRPRSSRTCVSRDCPSDFS